MTTNDVGPRRAAKKLLAALSLPEKHTDRIHFAKRAVAALKRAGYTSQARLWHALQEQKDRFDERTVKLSVSYWQQLYDEREDKIGALELLTRLFAVLRVLTPAYYRDSGLIALSDPQRFRFTTGVGPTCPPEMRLSLEQAFELWLSDGPTSGVVRPELGGKYEVFFPWFEDGSWTGSFARAEARIYRSTNRAWSFESFCRIGKLPSATFSGRLRFTGASSVVIVGFTSFVLAEDTRRSADESAPVYGREMLLHPYRLPATVGDWWHGSTAFIDASTGEYAATVGHIMRRLSSQVPDSGEWVRFTQRSTGLIGRRDSRYEELSHELARCPVRWSGR